MKEPKFYLNTKYVKLIPKQETYVPRIEFGVEKGEMLVNKIFLEFDTKNVSYGRFYFYDERK